MVWSRHARPTVRCNEIERLLCSSRAPVVDARPVLAPGVGRRKAHEALAQAATLLGEAQRALAPYRGDEDESALGRAYAAVHEAKGSLAAARHWWALETAVESAARV